MITVINFNCLETKEKNKKATRIVQREAFWSRRDVDAKTKGRNLILMKYDAAGSVCVSLQP